MEKEEQSFYTIACTDGTEIHIKNKPQKCSYCKGLILHPEDKHRVSRNASGKFITTTCKCIGGGEYYEQHNIESDSSCGSTSNVLEDQNYIYTKYDQEYADNNTEIEENDKPE